MTDLSKHVSSLTKSVDNLQRARNPAQKEAARGFLIQRGQELHAALQDLTAWLDEADKYLSAKMPEVNTDADDDYMVRWFEQLRNYERAQAALDNAWNAYMETLEAA